MWTVRRNPKIGFCLVEVFLFFGENILYLVVIAANILHGETEVFIFSPKTRKRP